MTDRLSDLNLNCWTRTPDRFLVGKHDEVCIGNALRQMIPEFLTRCIPNRCGVNFVQEADCVGDGVAAAVASVTLP